MFLQAEEADIIYQEVMAVMVVAVIAAIVAQAGTDGSYVFHELY